MRRRFRFVAALQPFAGRRIAMVEAIPVNPLVTDVLLKDELNISEESRTEDWRLNP